MGTIAANQINTIPTKTRRKAIKWDDVFPAMSKKRQRKKSLDLQDMQLHAHAQIAAHYRK